eukprot:169318-Chlamydomonas_euryale.AAC.3
MPVTASAPPQGAPRRSGRNRDVRTGKAVPESVSGSAESASSAGRFRIPHQGLTHCLDVPRVPCKGSECQSGLHTERITRCWIRAVFGTILTNPSSSYVCSYYHPNPTTFIDRKVKQQPHAVPLPSLCVLPSVHGFISTKNDDRSHCNCCQPDSGTAGHQPNHASMFRCRCRRSARSVGWGMKRPQPLHTPRCRARLRMCGMWDP